jgi:hypothetical protein
MPRAPWSASAEPPPDAFARCSTTRHDTTPLRYRDGESNASAEHFSWTTADLAAALIAEILAAPWDGRAPAADRAARRADLRALAL